MFSLSIVWDAITPNGRYKIQDKARYKMADRRYKICKIRDSKIQDTKLKIQRYVKQGKTRSKTQNGRYKNQRYNICKIQDM